MVVDRFEVDVERASAGERLVRADRVEELPVALDVDAEIVAVVDLVSVEVLVLERAEGAFADAVLAGALPLGADVDQLRMRVTKAAKRADLKHGPLSVTSATGRSSPVT